jgi:microcystin-dependent protein
MALTQVQTGMIADGAVTAQKLATGAASISGEMKMWPTASAPSGYLLCNGAAVSRTTYAALFAVLGTAFGAGDGSTTFNVPDMRDRMPIGAGTTYSANSQGGSKDAIIVSHTHTATDSGHSHVQTVYQAAANGGNIPVGFGNVGSNVTGAYSTSSSTANISVSTTGSSATNANLPPYLGIYFIIKT